MLIQKTHTNACQIQLGANLHPYLQAAIPVFPESFKVSYGKLSASLRMVHFFSSVTLDHSFSQDMHLLQLNCSAVQHNYEKDLNLPPIEVVTRMLNSVYLIYTVCCFNSPRSSAIPWP